MRRRAAAASAICGIWLAALVLRIAAAAERAGGQDKPETGGECSGDLHGGAGV